MANYTIEQVDYLREKAEVTYEEAVALLDQYQGDLTRCLIDLERNGRIRKAGSGGSNRTSYDWQGTWDQSYKSNYDYSGKQYKKPFVLDWTTLKSLLFSRVQVTKGDTMIANLSVVYLVIALFAAPWLVIGSVIGMFMLGYRVKWVRKGDEQQTEKDREVYEFVDKAARNIKRTATSFANAVKQEVDNAQEQAAQAPQQPEQPEATEDPEDNEPGDMTIE